MCEVVVSILCITYNHEKYIRRTLEGFLNQITSFKYEILIHDDASTDKTAEIIKEYAVKYPDKIKTIFQKENQYSKGKSGLNILIKWASGKYLAFCEGDDYWITEDKLEKQVKILEEKRECVACSHNEIVVNENEEPFGNKYQLIYREKEDKIYDKKTLIDRCKFSHSASLLIRRKLYLDMSDDVWEDYVDIKANGDMKIAALIAANGKIYHIAEDMACYRYVMSGNDSWTARNANKNICLITYEQLERIKKFILKNYGVELNYQEYYEILFLRSIKKFLTTPTKENWEIMKRLFKSNEYKYHDLLLTFLKMIDRKIKSIKKL